MILAIGEAQKITTKGQDVKIYLSRDNGLIDFNIGEVLSILAKLAIDYQVIQIISKANRKTSQMSVDDMIGFEQDFFEIKILDGFMPMFEGINKEYEEAEDKIVKYLTKQPTVKKIKETTKEGFLSIKYTKTRDLLLNDVFLLSKPDSFGENEAIMSYLYNHQNEELSISQIEVDLNIKISKHISKILDNLGFQKGLKDAFFKFGNGKILFKNPVPIKDLLESGIKIPIRIR